MAKATHFFIFGDHSWPVESFAKTLPEKSEVSIFVEGRGWLKASYREKSLAKTAGTKRASSTKRVLGELNAFDGYAPDEDLVAIVGFEDASQKQSLIDGLKSQNRRIRILELGTRGTRSSPRFQKRSVAWHDLISDGFGHEMNLLRIQDRVHELQGAFRDSGRIALLLQDDPDPDGLAAALALRKLLGRNAGTAGICSFGRITRPENVAMARLLEIEVDQVDVQKLIKNYDKVLLVDCQPSFFRGRLLPVHGIIDHHPNTVTAAEAELLDFLEIREDLGSISALLTLFLEAADVDISQRLATALLYGIKSDTLMLNRQVSAYDLEAFVYLYPKINFNTLRKIERPELPLAYLDRLRFALANVKVKNGICVLALGDVAREEWIAQAADFALQVEGAEWAVGVGILGDRVVLSVRVCGHLQHGGEIIKKLFNQVGCAGGHRVMAKAIVGTAEWKTHFGSLEAADMARTIRKLLAAEIAPAAH